MSPSLLEKAALIWIKPHRRRWRLFELRGPVLMSHRAKISHVFGAMCIASGLGAALGALATEIAPAFRFAVPVTLLVIVLLLCEHWTGPRA